MKEYHKINTVWKRAQEKPCPIIVGQYALPEFEYLADKPWVATEKVDGTNIRVMWDGQSIQFGGKTDSAQIPATLIARLRERFSDPEQFRSKFPDCDAVCLYGEGYGAKIQKAGSNYRPDQDFVLFDVRVGPWWLLRSAVEDVGFYFGLDVVPVVARGTLPELCEEAARGMRSTWGDFESEGLVMLPEVPLLTRSGTRIIAKIKTRDYAAL